MFEIAVALGAAGLAVLAFARRWRYAVCPSCGARALATENLIRANPVSWAQLRCTSCEAQYVGYVGGELISKAAFEAGGREPLPRARVVRGDRE